MNIAICEKCGQSLKHPVTYKGKVYGSDCAQTVSGLKSWEVRAAEGDLDNFINERSKRIASIEEKSAYYLSANSWLLHKLNKYTNPSTNNYNAFLHSMSNLLSNKEVKELSEKQFNALENFWANGLIGIEEGKARLEFIIASGIEEVNTDEEINEAKRMILSYGTLKELKELAKINKIKGYGKLKREELENYLVPVVNL